MSLASISIRRPVLAVVLNIILVLFGIMGYRSLGVREYPAIDPPIITVRTQYTGANAEIVESQITEPLEKAINGIAGIRNISSSSNQGLSNISVEFDLNIDLETAANDVRDKVQSVRNLPQDIDAPPVVVKADANSDAILSMTVKSNTRSQLEVNNYAVNVLMERLQTIAGVSSIQVWGEKKYAIRIFFHPDKMAARNITTTDVQLALNKENIELPAGKIVGSQTEITINAKGKLESVEDFKKLIVAQVQESPITLGDIARVELGPEKDESMLKESGVPMIALALVPLPGANYLDISNEFYRRFELLKKEVPEDIELNIALDSTHFIKKSITEVRSTIFIAFALVIVIILVFFRDWLMAIRPLIDIPISLIATFFVMYLFDFSINVLTLLGIVLATGLVVDDGIVVTENIYKKLEKGLKPKIAAREGVNEIFFAVIVTSITLAVVFLPLIFISGFVGKLFTEFGVVIAVSVLISSFVALTITPVLNVVLARKEAKKSSFYLKTEPFFRAMEQSYENTLSQFMKRKYLSWLGVVFTILLSIFLFKQLKSELSPLEDRDQFRVSLTMPEGTSFQAMDQFVNSLVDFAIDSIPEAETLLSVTAPGFIGSGAPNTGFMRVRLSEAGKRKRSQQDVVNDISPHMAHFSDGKIFIIQEQSISSGGRRGGLPVQFVLQHADFEKIRTFLPVFLDKVSQSSVFTLFDTDLKFNKPELEVTINRDKASELGVSVSDIAQTLQMAYSGKRFDYFTMEGKQYQVIGQMDWDYRSNVEDVLSLQVRNAKGTPIALGNLLQVETVSNPPQIFHFNRYKSVTVSAGLSPGFTIADGNKEMARIAKEVLDDTFSTELTGQSRDYAESSGNTSFAFIFALLLVYLILAAQFESFKSPLIIMITVPLAVSGALLTLYIFGQTLNIFSQIGMIMLLGLVTKNGILIVEFANQLLRKGSTVTDAALQAAVLRLRPILMTSLATILGALPIALALGAGAESRKPLGMVVVGGLLFSLVLTLYIIPALYASLVKKPNDDDET
jgi:multidrug efflux pump